jgi:SAM-dependent methyltransferase
MPPLLFERSNGGYAALPLSQGEVGVNCPICKSSESWPITATLAPDIVGWRAEAGETRPYSWRLCRQCGNGYPSDPPLTEVLNRYWQVDRNIGANENVDAVWQRRVAMSRVGADRSYKVFAPLYHGRPGRFFDIACGLGETVRKFGKHGWEAEGIDLDTSTLRFHQMSGLRTKIGRFEDEPLTSRYQMIHISHGIYFITEPMTFLRRVRAQLTDDGLFAVVISDFLAAHAQAGPSYTNTFYPCGESMSYALALAGLKPVLTRTFGGDIYIAAQPADVPPPRINTERIYRRYRTKNLRFATIGRPYLAARRLAKRILLVR